MAAFRKGHIKIVKWMVNHVTQFPSDQEMTRYVATINDKELLERCQECVRIIRAAKETQAAKANKNATILLEELDMEKSREECKKAAAARRRERKKKKKLEKKEEKRKLHAENKRNEGIFEVKDNSKIKIDECVNCKEDFDCNFQEASDNFDEILGISSRNRLVSREVNEKDNTHANSQERNDPKAREKKREKKKKKVSCNTCTTVDEENTSRFHDVLTTEIFSSTTSRECFTTYDTNK